MLAPIYLLLLLGEHGPIGPVQREFVRLSSPITIAISAASAITTAINETSAIDIEEDTA